ncbi:uncharacterized protein LOC144653611 [Oculina patagonica]
MRGSLLPMLISLLLLQVATAYVYRVVVSTSYSGTTDKVSIILVGQGGAETKAHDLPGDFGSKSDRLFTISDRDVGQLTAVKILLVQKGVWQDYWHLKQVSVITSRPRRVYIFSFNNQVKYQWNTIALKCRDGFKKTSDGKCVDIDECKDSGGCKDKIATCYNTIGSFRCSCPQGYNTDYQGGCSDVNECRRNNGGCSEYCHNSPGSYHCGCRSSGYRVVDGYRCEDIDECQEGKDNCDKTTTTCRNYAGSFVCDCKQGYTYKDRKSCQRQTCPHFNSGRDSHGTLEPARCFQKEQNKYEDKCKVVCNQGYVPATQAYVISSCGPQGSWVPYPTSCIGRQCPLLNDIKNGQVQDGCRISTQRYGDRCRYYCYNGYRLKGDYTRDCQANGTWSGTEPTCEKIHPKPYISCPADIYVVLKPGMSTADVSDKWTRPTANVKNITAVSPPGVSSSYQFPYGNTIVKWVAVNEIGEHDYCVVHVNVRDHEDPKIIFCPERIFKVSYTNDPVWVNISRPIFSDNVGIVRYSPPLIDGKYFTRHLGHYLYFEAVDASGNSAQCKIIVLVGGYRCQLPPEGPPGSSWTCNWFGGGSRYCARICPQGGKVFGTNGWWMCRSYTDGIWKFISHQPRPVAHCVGYKNVNTSLPCDVGSIRNSSFGLTGCYECPPGTYYKSGACEACAEGTYQDKTAQTSCKACPAGTSSMKGSYDCRPICPPGRYSKDGLGPFCEFCSNGTYQDKSQQTSCAACPKGTYTLHIGATFCGKSPQITKLEPGDAVSVKAGGTVVLKCFSQGEPAPSVYWQYSANGKGSKTQKQMKDEDGNPTGTQLTITNADSSDAGDYTCTSANTHGEITRAVHVTVTKSSSKRSTVQETKLAMDDFVPRTQDQCPTGKFSSDGLGPLCRVCPKNSYQDQPGETACKNCEHGTKTLQLAATSAEACGVAPVITSVNSSINMTSKEAFLDCYAHASPSPLVGWRFAEDIPSDFLGIPKLVQLVDDKETPVGTRMIIRAVTEFNTGRYECTAVNPFGQDEKTLDLKVPRV